MEFLGNQVSILQCQGPSSGGPSSAFAFPFLSCFRTVPFQKHESANAQKHSVRSIYLAIAQEKLLLYVEHRFTSSSLESDRHSIGCHLNPPSWQLATSCDTATYVSHSSSARNSTILPDAYRMYLERASITTQMCIVYLGKIHESIDMSTHISSEIYSENQPKRSHKNSRFIFLGNCKFLSITQMHLMQSSRVSNCQSKVDWLWYRTS